MERREYGPFFHHFDAESGTNTLILEISPSDVDVSEEMPYLVIHSRPFETKKILRQMTDIRCRFRYKMTNTRGVPTFVTKCLPPVAARYLSNYTKFALYVTLNK